MTVNGLANMELNDAEDDFMETYLAINLELKVKESENGSRMTRNKKNAAVTSARQSSKVSRYHSRLSAHSANKVRPLSKRHDQTIHNLAQSSREKGSHSSRRRSSQGEI